MGTLIAPASRAESGGVTVVSSVLHSDSQRGRGGTGAASSVLSRLLPGTSCWQAAGQAPGTNPSAAAAILAPWNGEPKVTTRRALCTPPSSRTHHSVATPPAEYPITSTDGAPARSARAAAALTALASATRLPVPLPGKCTTVAWRPVDRIRRASTDSDPVLPP